MDRSEINYDEILETVKEILTKDNVIVSCIDLLDRLDSENVITNGMTPSMLAVILKDDESFDEISKEIFRIRQ